ncbi:very short patch repair endonuclease [Nautilia lithotrophica]
MKKLVTDKKTSERMKKIKSKNTKIEIILRKALWNEGIRYRINCKDVFGKPDICFKKYKIAVFCDSEFWHGKKFLEGEKFKRNKDFWESKILRNIERDKKVNQILKEEGWTVLRFWGNEIIKNTEEVVNKIKEVLENKKNENKKIKG